MTDTTETTTDAWEWLQQVRGLDAELLDRLGVKARGNMVGVPYVRRGRHYGWKRRTIEKRFWFEPSDVEHFLWNRDILDDDTLADQPIIITEGEFDALSVMQAGHVRVVSIPDGWTDGMEGGDGAKMRPLIEAEGALRNSPCVIVAGDNDSTGASFLRAVGGLLEGHPVRYVEWPDDCKDANDVLRKLGEAEIVTRINSAKTLDPKGGTITGFSDLPPLPDRRVLRLGMPPFDYVMAFEVKAMSVLTGIPGHGKSTLMRFACHHIIKHENIRVGHIGLETHAHALRDHLSRLATGKAWSDLVTAERDRLTETLDRHWRVVHRVYSGDVGHNLGWLRSMVHALAVRDQCKMIVLDPWNELEHLPEKGESMTQYINFALQQIRQWAEQWDCHIAVVAHPRKIGHDGKIFIPSGYDIAESAAFANKPSLGLTVHMVDGNDPHVKLRVWKVRDVNLYGFGKGTAEVEFDPGMMTYRRRTHA